MELRELQFWVREACRAEDAKELRMSNAVRYAQHADPKEYEGYATRLRSRPESSETAETYREKWAELKARGRG